MTEPAALADFWDYRVKKTAAKLSARARAALVRARSSLGRRIGLDDPAYVRSSYGVLMRANWADRTFQYCRYGTYGTALVDLIGSVKEPFSFLDIGANQGLYSLLATANPHCRHVWALEPVRHTHRLLQDNIAANGLADRITAIEAALSDRSGTATMAADPLHSGAASLEHGSAGEGSSPHDVRLIDHEALDALIASSEALVVKVDVEGHEKVAITELMKSSHAAAIRHIFYEIDQRWTDGDEIAALLRRSGFAHFRKFGVGRHYDVLASR